MRFTFGQQFDELLEFIDNQITNDEPVSNQEQTIFACEVIEKFKEAKQKRIEYLRAMGNSYAQWVRENGGM